MLPIIIDPEYVKALVAGDGPATKNRIKMLKAAGIKDFKYIKNVPKDSDFESVNIAYIADFSDEISAQIAEMARAKNIILNIEDKKKFCDFHVPSIIRQGSLLLTISTEGKSPRVARRLRRIFEKIFDDNWASELDNIGTLREGWKAKGAGYQELAEYTDEYIESKNLMGNFCDKCKENSV